MFRTESRLYILPLSDGLGEKASVTRGGDVGEELCATHIADAVVHQLPFFSVQFLSAFYSFVVSVSFLFFFPPEM